MLRIKYGEMYVRRDNSHIRDRLLILEVKDLNVCTSKEIAARRERERERENVRFFARNSWSEEESVKNVTKVRGVHSPAQSR